MFDSSKVRFAIRNIAEKGSLVPVWAVVCKYIGTDIEVFLNCGPLTAAKELYITAVKERHIVDDPVRKAFEEQSIAAA